MTADGAPGEDPAHRPFATTRLPRTFCPDCGQALVFERHGGGEHPYCTGCGYVRYRNPAVGVAVVVRDGQGHVLMGRRARGPYAGLWCIPCGYVEWDEDVRAAARRELREETGLIAATGGVIAVHSNFHNAAQHTVGIWFAGMVAGGELAPADGELTELAYFDPATPPPLAFPTDALVLAQLTEEAAHEAETIALSRTDGRIPAGVPFSRSIVPASSQTKRRIRLVLACIDSVHGIGILPSTKVSIDNRMTDLARFAVKFGESTIRLRMRRNPTPELAFLHEVGHVLDAIALGASGAYASPMHKELDTWRQAVSTTGAFQTLTEAHEEGLSGLEPGLAAYSLAAPELFARSYSQYVAERSHNKLLTAQLEVVSDAIGLPLHWSGDDFDVVRDAFDELFSSRGWLR
ncbi:MAG: NUDIX hydrolase [Chloroflexi bacterium]|nr:NUDIX hydrolase [Chloroflexota bacterium]